MSDLIKITGLWENDKGNLSGADGQKRWIVIRNKDRDTDRHPTHLLFLAPNKPRDEEKPAPNPTDPGQPTPDGKDIIPF
jgi:hypothetical protein